MVWAATAIAGVGLVNQLSQPGGLLGPSLPSGQSGSGGGSNQLGLGSSLQGQGEANITSTAAAIQTANPNMDATTAANFAQAGYTPNDIAAMQQNGVSPADMTTIGSNLSSLAAGATPASLNLGQAAQNFLSGPTGQALINAAYTGAGAAYQTNAQGQIGNILATGQQNAANIQSNAALKAANLQSTAATQAGQTAATGATTAAGQAVAGEQQVIGTAQNTLAQQQQLQQPYQTAGTQALQTLSAGLQPGGQFNTPFTMADAQNMPAYNFALQQGTNAINNAAAAGGTQLSSANIQSLGSFASGTAAQYEQQAFNQWLAQNNLSLGALQNMVATGQISTGQLNTALQNAGISVQTAQENIGKANAAGTLGAAAATAQAGQTAANYQGAGMQQAANAQALGIQGISNAQANALNNQSGIIQQAQNANAGNASQLITSGVGSAINALGNINFPSSSTTTAATPSNTYNQYAMGSAGGPVNLANSTPAAATTAPTSLSSAYTSGYGTSATDPYGIGMNTVSPLPTTGP